jgi:2-polyprenyl-6-hydroxyphenyl methylase/3-demethylubiquinone-9 3-methyltransferase
MEDVSERSMTVPALDYGEQIASDLRFEFGENWKKFLATITEERILEAERSLRSTLGARGLHGMTFLDVGSGSGLFSLAARRLGARVRSFDYDQQSVNCTAELRRRYFGDDCEWIVEQGSVLDRAYLEPLGKFDVVYAWGVLHHTGAMWQALENLTLVIAPNGVLWTAIYNDQGAKSERWLRVKRLYNRSPLLVRLLVLGYVATCTRGSWARVLIKDTLRGRPLMTWHSYGQQRGMHPWRDVVDWAGGYPFEVAKPERIFNLYRDRGFLLEKLTTCGGGPGNNEYVFRHAGVFRGASFSDA